MTGLRSTRALAMLIGILVLTGPPQSVRADQRDRDIVGLAYEVATHSLLKVDGRALYRSADEGGNWHKVTDAPIEGGRISSLATSPAVKGVLYIAGSGLGVFRSENDGKTWSERNEGLPSRDVIAVAAHTTQAETVYAVLKDQGVYRSQDAGKSWRLMERASQQGLRQLIHSNMAGSMQTGWLFAATAEGVRRAMDCFCLWQDAGKLGGRAYSVGYDPKQPDHVYTATEQGLFRSTDGGEDWLKIESPSADVIGIVVTPSGALFVINAEGSLYKSEDQGGRWTQVNA